MLPSNIIDTPDLNETRRIIQKLKHKNTGEFIALLSQDDEFNRKALEIKGLNMLVINENLNQKDYMKQRNSGLNEVLAEICSKNNIKIGFDIGAIINKGDIEKAKSLARLKQNIMLCRKSNCKIALIGQDKDNKSFQSLLLCLGASTKQVQEAAN